MRKTLVCACSRWLVLPAGYGRRRPSARQAVELVAAALGGADRIRALKNIVLMGYAQYAYQNGGGNISPLVVTEYSIWRVLTAHPSWRRDRRDIVDGAVRAFTLTVAA